MRRPTHQRPDGPCPVRPDRRKVGAVAMVLALVAGVAAITVTMSVRNAAPSLAATALPDDFYVPPSPLPAGQPGDVIRSRPSKAGPPAAVALADAWQVMYLSTDARGRPIPVTGTILVPKAAPVGTRPIVALAPGTHGPAFRCTVSRMIDGGAFYEQPALNDLLGDGYAVAITDYEGYRPEARTTYIVGGSTGPAVLNSVRAAQRLGVGLSATAPVAIRGYSQGGGAAMWAGQMQPTYAPELRLVGVAGGGVPADPVQLALTLDGQLGWGVLAYALIGLDNAYPELQLDSYLNPLGRTEFDKIRSDTCVFELLKDYQGRHLNDYFTTSPLFEPGWQARYAQNKLGQQPIAVPVFMYQSTNDVIVSFTQAQTLKTTYCQKGVNLTWQTYDPHITGIPSHTHLIYAANQDIRRFIADRFAGVPASSNC